jgi:uncharacterized protein (TIGR02453 family)
MNELITMDCNIQFGQLYYFCSLNTNNFENMETIIAFLEELKNNNTREWFLANRDWYEETKTKFELLVNEVIRGISVFDPETHFLTAKDCVFRIYRDVRFSKNKDPYKAHFGASINKGGRNSRFAGYYFHIEPGNSFVGGGKWQPSPEILKAIRYEIYQSPEEFKSIINLKPFVQRFGSLSDEKLQRPPKDFPADFEDIELLKYKSYIVGANMSDEELKKESYLPFVVETCKIMNPFIDFLNRSISHL